MSENKLALIGLFAIVPLLIVFSNGCSATKKTMNGDEKFLNVGHRGARGLKPENTIPSMKMGIEAGANAIEFDLHVTKDGQVVLYHDASLNPGFTLLPDGSDFMNADRRNYVLYRMDYKHIRNFIVGKKYFASFPEQRLEVSYVPLLSEVIDSVESYIKARNLPPVIYMPEIKSSPSKYGIDQPSATEYVEKIMAVLEPWLKQVGDRLVIQCYDKQVLRLIHDKYPMVRLALLAKKATPINNEIKELGFVPSFYLPEFRLVTSEMMQECHAKNIKVIPWTSNDKTDMSRLISLKVDGIITDYPNRLNEVVGNKM